MEFKGVQGNWLVDEEEFFVNEFNVEVYVISNEDRTEVQIADIYGSKENALLISKAPEMLEMLELACIELESGAKKHWEIYTMMKKLIKEATEL